MLTVCFQCFDPMMLQNEVYRCQKIAGGEYINSKLTFIWTFRGEHIVHASVRVLKTRHITMETLRVLCLERVQYIVMFIFSTGVKICQENRCCEVDHLHVFLMERNTIYTLLMC